MRDVTLDNVPITLVTDDLGAVVLGQRDRSPSVVWLSLRQWADHITSTRGQTVLRLPAPGALMFFNDNQFVLWPSGDAITTGVNVSTGMRFPTKLPPGILAVAVPEQAPYTPALITIKDAGGNPHIVDVGTVRAHASLIVGTREERIRCFLVPASEHAVRSAVRRALSDDAQAGNLSETLRTVLASGE